LADVKDVGDALGLKSGDAGEGVRVDLGPAREKELVVDFEAN